MKSRGPRILLRGHHLICLHFFHGEGYHPEFISHLEERLSLARRGAKIELCEGPDEICAMCPYLRNRICHYGENAEQEIREMDHTASLLLGLHPPDTVKWNALSSMIPDIFGKWTDRYCGLCTWRRACEKSRLFKRLHSSLHTP